MQREVPILHEPLTAEEFILLTLEDDTEEAPWMVMGDRQFWATSDLAQALRAYAHAHNHGWYVASMLPILYPRPTTSVKGMLSPDVFVAFAEERPRQSYDLEVEGGFPPFVLEVLSPESAQRDVELKVTAYGRLGAREYALFSPIEDYGQPVLKGYRRDRLTGTFAPWEPDETGRLHSDVLGLWLVPQGSALRAQEPGGALLPTYEELNAETARLRAELARRRSD